MSARTKRALIARGANARDNAGRAADLRLATTPLVDMRAHPEDGSHRNLRVKSQIRKIPTRKLGTDSAAVVNPVAALSTRLPSR